MAREQLLSARSIIEPRLRIKQRDYTIPVRLNQLPVVQSQLELVMTKRSKPSISGGHIHKNYDSDGTSIKRCTHNTKSNDMIQNQISIKSKRSAPLCKNLLMAIAIVSCTYCLVSESILCDNNLRESLVQSISSAAVSSKSPSANHHNGKRNSASADHKEHLLSYLSDNIERQHFKMKPSRVFTHQRPSKFDSGHDLGIDFMSSQSSSQRDSSVEKSPNSLAAIDKANQGMKQIMQLHEQANHHSLASPISSSISGDATGSSQSSPSSNTLVNKWRDISRAPARVASTLINPSKVVTQVLSYISPLIGASKLIDPSVLIQKSVLQNSTGAGGSNIVSRLLLNPFTGRSINSKAAAGSLFGYERNKGSQISLFVTQSPQTAYLVRPDLLKLTASGRQYTTPSTNLLDALMGESTSSSSKDPSADSSSPLAESVESENSKADDPGDNDTAQQAKTILRPENVGRLWLKDSANQLAQSYLQNSFRGLLTLSQLPILPSGSVSSAPSELEKNKLSFINKLRNTQVTNNSGKHPVNQNQQNHTLSLNSQSQRRRAIDELYRYAYILSTGIGRKRDPLVALGSSQPSRPSMFNQNQGAFSQRSKGLLTSIQNQKQMLDYAKILKSALMPNALNKAKPRGVMWDMATDPSLAVTVFSLLERASVALPLGFLLMPFVRMIRNPLNGIDFGRIIPARASHRSVDYEELAKRLDVVDKMLSRALRPTHREY